MFRGIKQKHIIALFLVSLALAGAANYAWRSFAATYYTLTLNKSPDVVGVVSGSGKYVSGTRVNVSAKIDSNYTGFYIFKKWVRDNGSEYSDNPLSVLVDRDKTFTAFYWPQVTVSVSPSGGGYVNSGGGGIKNCGSGGSCVVSYERQASSGTNYTNLTAYANSGYSFSNWEYTRSDKTTGTNKNSLIKLDQHWGWKATANFVKNVSTVTPPNPQPPTNNTSSPKTNPPTKTPANSTPATSKKETATRSYPNSQKISTLPEDTEAPTPPSGLVASYVADQNLVELIWSASEDNVVVEGYEIERRDKGTENWTKITKITSEEYTDFDFVPNKSYEYRVRAFDAKMNFSDYSNIAEVVTGDFKPNVTVKDGGTVTDEENKVSVTFPANAISEDLYVLIEKVNSKEIKGIKLGKNTRIIGDVFSIRAKGFKGEDINKFKTQVALRFKTDYLRGVNEKSIKLAIIGEDKYTTLLHTNYNEELKSVETLTDHFSIYVMTAPSTGFWGIFIKVLAWIIILGGIGTGGYFGWQKYELAKYQKEHREDYIYKH